MQTNIKVQNQKSTKPKKYKTKKVQNQKVQNLQNSTKFVATSQSPFVDAEKYNRIKLHF